MKKNKLIPLTILLFMLIAGCAKDTTTAPTSSDARSTFEGGWLCTENTANNPKFTITISRDASNSTTINIYNINELGAKFFAYAYVSNNNLTIPSQTISLDTYEGNGQLVANKITLNYKITDANKIVQNVQAICTPK
jgi:hypothetical protein